MTDAESRTKRSRGHHRQLNAGSIRTWAASLAALKESVRHRLDFAPGRPAGENKKLG